MKDNLWVSAKGVVYILSPKRGAWSTVNPDVCQSLTASGMRNWIGTFVSPDIDHIEREPKQGGSVPTKIVLKNGKVLWCDGKRIYE